MFHLSVSHINKFNDLPFTTYTEIIEFTKLTINIMYVNRKTHSERAIKIAIEKSSPVCK